MLLPSHPFQRQFQTAVGIRLRAASPNATENSREIEDTDRVELGETPKPDARALAWQSLETAGLLSARANPGPLGPVLTEVQREGLLAVLQDIEECGGRFYTGRGKKLTPRKADYVLTKVLEKNPSRLKSSLWVGKDPQEERRPVQISSLRDLRIAQDLYGTPSLEGLSDGSQSIRNLEEAGMMFFRSPRNGHSAKDVGPIEAFRVIRGEHYRAISIGTEDSSSFQRHRVANLSTLGQVDFFHGSGSPAAIHQPEEAKALKELLDLGLELHGPDNEDQPVKTYQEFLDGASLKVNLHGQTLGTIEAESTSEKIRAQGQIFRQEVERSHQALKALEGEVPRFDLPSFYLATREPMAGVSFAEQGELAAKLVRALPKELPEQGRAPGRSFAAELFTDLKTLAPDGARLERLVEEACATLETLHQGQNFKLARKLNSDGEKVALRATVMASLPVSSETPLQRMQLLARLAEPVHELKNPVDLFMALARANRPEQSLEGSVGRLATLLKTTRSNSYGDLGKELEPMAKLLAPIGDSTVDDRLEVLESLENSIGVFSLSEGRTAIYEAVGQRLSEGADPKTVAERIALRVGRLNSELDFGKPGFSRKSLVKATANLFFKDFPANGNFENVLAAVKELSQTFGLSEAAEYLSRMQAADPGSETLTAPGQALSAALTLNKVMGKNEALEAALDLQTYPETSLNLSERAETLARVKGQVRHGQVRRILFEDLVEAVPDPAEREIFRSHLPRLAKMSSNGLQLGQLLTALIGSVPAAESDQAISFMERLQEQSAADLPNRILTQALELVANRRKPEQSFAEAAAPLAKALPYLTDRLELVTTLTTLCPPQDFEAGVGISGRLNAASFQKMTDQVMGDCLRHLLEVRDPEEPLEKAAKPLLILGRLLANQPEETAETYRFLTSRAKTNQTSIAEELGLFENLFVETFDAGVTREVLSMKSGTADDPGTLDIAWEDNLVWFGEFSLPRD